MQFAANGQFVLVFISIPALAAQMNGDMAVTAVSRELGRDLRQDEMDLLHYPRVCAESGGGGANQVV